MLINLIMKNLNFWASSDIINKIKKQIDLNGTVILSSFWYEVTMHLNVKDNKWIIT